MRLRPLRRHRLTLCVLCSGGFAAMAGHWPDRLSPANARTGIAQCSGCNRLTLHGAHSVYRIFY